MKSLGKLYDCDVKKIKVCKKFQTLCEKSFAIHTLCEWVPRVVMPELGSATICPGIIYATSGATL